MYSIPQISHQERMEFVTELVVTAMEQIDPLSTAITNAVGEGNTLRGYILTKQSLDLVVQLIIEMSKHLSFFEEAPLIIKQHVVKLSNNVLALHKDVMNAIAAFEKRGYDATN